MNLGNKKSNLLILLAAFIVGGCGNSSGNYEEIESSISSDTTTSSDSTASFVAVGNSGTILSSSDGTTWTSVNRITQTYDNWTTENISSNDVTYGNGTFVVVSPNGLILTSTDVTSSWTKRTSGTINDLYGVTYKE